LTRRGWTLAGAAVGLVVGSVLLAADGLAVLGVAGVAGLAGAWLWLVLAHVPVTGRRRVEPRRVEAGGTVRVEIELTGRPRRGGSRQGPLLQVEGATLVRRVASAGPTGRGPSGAGDGSADDGEPTASRGATTPGAASAVLPAPAPGEVVEVGRRLSVGRRGILVLAPARARLYDPLRLATRTWPVTEPTELVVLPRIHVIAPPLGLGAGVVGGDRATVAQAIAPDAHGEFHALREYVRGDDLRRVHWRSTARTGELMIRQDDALAHARVHVVLDVRADGYDEASFEHAVEAAASIAVRITRSRRELTLVTTDGTVLTVARRPTALDLLLDELAIVTPRHDVEPAVMRRALEAVAGPGLLVLVTGVADDALRVLAATRARAGDAILVTTRDRAVAGHALVVDASTQPFREAWNRAMSGRTGAGSRTPSWTVAAR
jgi:uncharacterized protein (DUF58 family)